MENWDNPLTFKDAILYENKSPQEYLKKAKLYAKASGYDPNLLTFSEDYIHKLDYNGVVFGRVGYGDFILWTMREEAGEAPTGYAEKKRKGYLARASQIKGDWKNKKESKNNLAIKILWAG